MMAAADENQTVFGEEETAEFDAPTVVPDDNLTVVGEEETAEFDAPTVVPDDNLTVVGEQTEFESGHSEAANPAGPARAPGRSSGSEPTFEIPMPAPTEMSDTLPPSSITWPPSIRGGRLPEATAAAPGTIERMSHQIQGLESQNHVLRSTVEALSVSVATLAAAASSSSSGVTAVPGPATAAAASTTPWVDPMIAKGNKRFAQPRNEWEWWERQRRDAKNLAEADRKQRKTLAQAKSKSAASPGPHL